MGLTINRTTAGPEDELSPDDLAAIQDIYRGGTGDPPDTRTNEERIIAVVGDGDSYARIKRLAAVVDDAEKRGALKAAEIRQDVARLEVRLEAAERELAAERKASHRALVEASELRETNAGLSRRVGIAEGIAESATSENRRMADALAGALNKTTAGQAPAATNCDPEGRR